MAFMQKSTRARLAKLISIASSPCTFHNTMADRDELVKIVNAQTTELNILDQKLAKAKRLLEDNKTTHTKLVEILDSLLRKNQEEQSLHDMKTRLDTLCRNDNSCEIDIEPAEALDSEYLHELIKTRNDKRSEIEILDEDCMLRAKFQNLSERGNLKTRMKQVPHN